MPAEATQLVPMGTLGRVISAEPFVTRSWRCGVARTVKGAASGASGSVQVRVTV